MINGVRPRIELNTTSILLQYYPIQTKFSHFSVVNKSGEKSLVVYVFLDIRLLCSSKKHKPLFKFRHFYLPPKNG
jgi:hypothetical protein